MRRYLLCMTLNVMMATGCGATRSPGMVETSSVARANPLVVAPRETASVAIAMASAQRTETPTPISPPPPDPPALPVDDGPVLDCSSYSLGGLPGRRYLCEVAMGAAASALLDEKGYALITQFDEPGEDVDAREGHMNARVCGKEAAIRLRSLFRSLRYKLSSTEQASMVSCHGLECDLQGEGEWSRNESLYFRYGKKGLVLEAWTSLESVLVEPAVVLEREKFIAKGRKELANAPCPQEAAPLP